MNPLPPVEVEPHPWRGLAWLTRRECHRVLKLWKQTILAPVISALLFMIVFGLSLGDSIASIGGIEYEIFIVPGLIAMAMAQSAYSNNSSTIFQARNDRYLDDILSAPMSAWQVHLGYLAGGAIDKSFLFQGGVETVAQSGPGGRLNAIEAYLEGAAKAVHLLRCSAPAADEVLVSGRAAADADLVDRLAGMLTGVATVRLFTVTGTATAADFTGRPNTAASAVTFLDGETTKTVTIPITADNVAELNNETFTVTLGSPTPAGATIFLPVGTTTVTIFNGIMVNTLADEFNTPSGPNVSLREALRDYQQRDRRFGRVNA